MAIYLHILCVHMFMCVTVCVLCVLCVLCVCVSVAVCECVSIARGISWRLDSLYLRSGAAHQANDGDPKPPVAQMAGGIQCRRYY